MDRMYAPWRLAYVKGAAQTDVVEAPSGCIFCDYILAPGAALPVAQANRIVAPSTSVVTSSRCANGRS